MRAEAGRRQLFRHRRRFGIAVFSFSSLCSLHAQPNTRTVDAGRGGRGCRSESYGTGVGAGCPWHRPLQLTVKEAELRVNYAAVGSASLSHPLDGSRSIDLATAFLRSFLQRAISSAVASRGGGPAGFSEFLGCASMSPCFCGDETGPRR